MSGRKGRRGEGMEGEKGRKGSRWPYVGMGPLIVIQALTKSQ